MSFVQAAFLDLRLADTLGQLLGRLVPVLGQGADAGSLCTMVLEAILTLQDPENCLNPMAPAAQRVPDETPTPAEVCPHASSACLEHELVAVAAVQRHGCCFFACAPYHSCELGVNCGVAGQVYQVFAKEEAVL